MNAEYLNEAADILDSKIESGEVSLESATAAYESILDTAVNEFVDEVLESVDEGALSSIEANLLFEMTGLLDEEDIAVVEASFDLSGLSADERKAVEDKLKKLSPAQRKAAEKALAQKFPNADAEKEAAEKKAKRNKILKAAGAIAGAAAVGTAATIAGKKIKEGKDEKATITPNNPAYSKIFAARDEAIKKLNNSDKFKDYVNRNADGALGAGAKLRLSKMAPSEKAMLGDEYKAELKAIEDNFKSKLGNAIGKERQTEGYKARVKEQAKNIRNIDKAKKAQMKKNAKYAQMDAEWYASNNPFGLARKAKSAGASVLNAPTKAGNTVKNFFGKTDEVKDLKHKETGVTSKGVAKNAAASLAEMNKKTSDTYDKIEKKLNKK